MINKLEFNNLLMTNKQTIQSIKTHTIQKLVQKIRKLKYILEKKPDHKKNSERFRKATSTLEELKKLKCLDLMKRVLVLEKSPSSIITNGLCTPEEMAVALVAVNKIMHELVNTFRENLGFTDENELWKSELMQTSKRRIKILRTEQKRKSRQYLKEQKIMTRKRMEWLKNQKIGAQSMGNADNGNVKKIREDDEGANVSTLGYWRIEAIESCKKSKKDKIKKIGIKEKISIKKRSPEKNSTHVVKCAPKVVNLTEAIKLSDTKDRDIDTNDIESSKSMPSGLKVVLDRQTSPETLKEDITHVIDPFFITSSGGNYRSSAVIVRNGQVFDPQRNKINEANKAAGNAQQKSRDYKKLGNSHDFNVKNKRVLSKKLSRTGNENNTKGMHPSWVAKQKLKPVIGSFQGKKIKFEDNDSNEIQIKEQIGTKLQNQENGRKNHLGANSRMKSEAVDRHLHPSWLAKQKLKPAIVDFKGKKIIFGDGIEEITKPQEIINVSESKKKAEKLKTTDALHPSWVAKQKLKPTITAFQGKKITFEDD